MTIAIFKASKFSNFSNRLLEIDFPFKNSIICTAISHIFISYSFFKHFYHSCLNNNKPIQYRYFSGVMNVSCSAA